MRATTLVALQQRPGSSGRLKIASIEDDHDQVLDAHRAFSPVPPAVGETVRGLAPPGGRNFGAPASVLWVARSRYPWSRVNLGLLDLEYYSYFLSRAPANGR